MSFQISDEEFSQLRKIIFDQFGINLTDAKKTLLVGRLQGILTKYKLPNFKSYYDMITNSSDLSLLSELVNKISTNFTYFYREEKHFEFFIESVVPSIILQLTKKGEKDLRFWCAGCASGEEPYTIIMMLLEKLGHQYKNYDIGILATDISEDALAFATAGRYPEDRLSKLPLKLKNSYFTKSSESEDDYLISEKIKQEVTFRRFNLMNETFPFKKKFHAIFCRNVMIYFDNPTKDRLIKKFHQHLEPEGILFIGHSETLGREHEEFEYIMPAAYRKKEGTSL